MVPSERPAAQLRVLVTRPVGDAADTLCAAIGAAGHQAFSQPLLVLTALEHLSAAQRRLLVHLDQYQHVILISANAVQFGMALVEDHWPQLPFGLHWYAIGAATAAGLARFGIKAVTPGSSMSSEGLLAVPALQQVAQQRVLIIKGEGGRATLAEELGRRGAAVDELACYRRSVPTLQPGALGAQLARWGIDVILLSSGEGLANLQVLLSPAETSKLKQIGVIVPSQRVAHMAQVAGFKRIAIAENASDAAMLQALQQWRAGTGA
jgi:uroporphyrinogen-III synthase